MLLMFFTFDVSKFIKFKPIIFLQLQNIPDISSTLTVLKFDKSIVINLSQA